MKNNKYFSTALFVENLKRFWGVSVVGCLMFFAFGGFAILEERRGGYYPGTIKAFLNNQSPWEFALFILPIVSALCVFSYLQKVNSVNVMHSQPYSRLSLYVSSCASGYALCAIPAFINAISLLAIRKETRMEISDAASAASASVDYFSVGNIFSWLLGSLLIMLFIYSIAVFANIVSGNSVIAVLTSVAANFIVPAIIICIEYLKYEIIRGYDFNQNIWSVLAKTNPLLCTLLGSGGLSAGYSVIMLIVSILILAAAWFLYKCRKLERCGDAYVYEWVIVFVGFMFVFIPSVAFWAGLGLGLLSMTSSALIGFVIGQMITRKTFKIFDLKSLKNLAIYAAAMIVILGTLYLDLFGIAKQIPDVSKVEEVEINYTYTSSYLTFKETDNIETVEQLHKKILDDKSVSSENSHEYYLENYSYITFKYELKNGSTVSRYYLLPEGFLEESEELKELISSEEYLAPVTNIKLLNDSNLVIESLEIDSESGDLSIIVPNEFSQATRNRLMDAIIREYSERQKNSGSSNGDSDYTIYVSLIYYLDTSDISYETKLDQMKSIRGFQYMYIDRNGDEERAELHYSYYLYDSDELAELIAGDIISNPQAI